MALTVKASDVFRLAAANTGQPWNSDTGGGVQRDTMRQLAPWLNSRLQQIWRMGRWPEVIQPPQERRNLQTFWAPNTAYSSGSQVGHLDTHWGYIAISNVPANTKPNCGTPGYWQRLLRRYTAAPWCETVTYSAGQLVRDQATLGYYAAQLSPPALGVSPTSGGQPNTGWFPLPLWDSTFLYSDAWNSGTMGDVLRADQTDPQADTWAETMGDSDYDLFPNANGVLLSQDVSLAWFTFKAPVPLLFGDLYDSTAVYGAGAQVYYQSPPGGLLGDFYTAPNGAAAGLSPETTPSLWQVQPIPARFFNWLAYATAVSWLDSEGQTDKAALIRTRELMPELDQLMIQLSRIRSSSGKMNVLTRTEGRR